MRTRICVAALGGRQRRTDGRGLALLLLVECCASPELQLGSAVSMSLAAEADDLACVCAAAAGGAASRGEAGQ